MIKHFNSVVLFTYLLSCKVFKIRKVCYMASKTEEQMKNLFSDRIVTCPVCGKQFIREVNHLYKVRNSRKDNTLYFCRYTHWMQWKRDNGRQ